MKCYGSTRSGDSWHLAREGRPATSLCNRRLRTSAPMYMLSSEGVCKVCLKIEKRLEQVQAEPF